MDVRFTNVLEGARQYFQGVPAGTGAAAGPPYPSDGQQRRDSEQNRDMPPSSSSYWPPQSAEASRQTPKDVAPVQRPPSHASDAPAPPPGSQYVPNAAPEQGRPYQAYAEPYALPQHQQQPFQFSRPQSREAPSNHAQYPQPHAPSSSSYHPPSPYHQIPSPQLPRAPSREQLVPRTPSREQLTPQYPQSSESYTYPQPRSYYPPPQAKSVATSNLQQNYYKHIYSTQATTSQQNVYANTRVNIAQPEGQAYQNNHSASSESNAEVRTHNLPPIAALSSYHSSRTVREPQRPISTASRTRTFTTSSYTASTSQQITQNAPAGTSSIVQNSSRPLPYAPSSSAGYQEDYHRLYGHPQQAYPHYPATVTNTQSYGQVIMTTTNTTGYYSSPNQNQSSSQNQQPYYQPSKPNPQSAPGARSQPIASLPQNPQPQTTDHNLNGRLVMKRESPLDLSVKTVRTPADSTLDSTDASRNKYYQNRPAHSSISAQNYPQLDVNNSFNRSLAQRPAPLPKASAPKVEFRPNFNVNQPPRLTKRLEKDHSNSNRLTYEKIVPPPGGISTSKYPTVSIPSAAHVNSFIQSSHVPSKNNIGNVPRMAFPSGHKTNSLYGEALDVHKKRPADVAPSIVAPSKIPKVDPWRQSIDQEIEHRLSSYKQQQQGKLVPNGNYSAVNQDRGKEMFPHQHPPYNAPSHYPSQTNHNQTYVPSPATHQYLGYAGHPSQPPLNSYPHPASRSNSNPSLTTLTNAKNNLGGVDKRVINILRNSLEVKGQKKLEQMKSHENLTQHPRSDVQHPSTHVTAPLQPRPGLIGRNNVSPFTPTSFPDNTNMASMYKFHLPKAIESVNFEATKNSVPIITEKQTDTVITNHSSSNTDYDGLAAFLAARIRTKGELKQGGPAGPNTSNNNTALIDTRLQGIIENQLKSPVKHELSQSSTNCSSSGTTMSSSSAKSKERQTSLAPRKRLFSRNEEENSNNNVPHRDKSGLRSSSETSVFDFPDSDSENDVVGRESLEAMRKGRKISARQTTPINSTDVKVECPRTPSPTDDIFAKLCDTFVEQLKSSAGKRKVKRKKTLEPEVLAKLQTVTKERPLESETKIKVELEECKKTENNRVLENVKGKQSEIKIEVKSEQSDFKENLDFKESTLKVESDAKSAETAIDDDPIVMGNKRNARRRLISSSDSSDSDSEKIKKEIKCGEDLNISLDDKKLGKSTIDIKKESETPDKSKKVVPIVRPAKKPSFGDGSDFYPGWEEGVYKYKKSLRMPPTLIQVSRPPQFHRLSTSLPDLDPYPQSPTTSIANDNEKESICKKYKKIKSECLDSDNESTCSFNIFNKKTNYDSEGSASVRSLPNTAKEMSILDKLLEKCGGKKKRKYKRKDDHSPRIIQNSKNPVELLPTPTLEDKEKPDKGDSKTKSHRIKKESSLLAFRKKTINNFKDAFIKSANNIVGVNEQFTTVVLKSRTRKESRVLKQRATIKEVFGEDRPASAPPVTCVKHHKIKEELCESEDNCCLKEILIKLVKKEEEKDKKINEDQNAVKTDTKQVLKNKILTKKGKKTEKNNVPKTLKKKIKIEIQEEPEHNQNLEDIVIKRDPDEKSDTISVDGDEGSISGKKRGKFGKMRRKLSSGFDYIRKKKKIKKENIENECSEKKKKKTFLPKTPESVDDIQKEIKSWVLNKGIGETHLHRSARLGYADVTAYCLEKMNCNPSPKDNAGYTPLHEACSRGHLEIAKLLLQYGANASESAQGGIRPLHEAVENGFVEIARLLLSYGADPTLATYSGLTPLALTNDEVTKDFLKNHLNDIEGEDSSPWVLHGPASFFDPLEGIGFDILDGMPAADPEDEEDDIEFEVSEMNLPNLYTLRGEAPKDRWILLQDLSNLLKIKSRDALLRQISPPSTSGAQVNKAILRELKMSDFLEQAHCCQFLNAGEKINARASKIALVKYTDKVKELLNVECDTITAR